MALPLRSSQPLQPHPVGTPARAVGPCRQRPSPQRPSRAVLTAVGGAHGQRRRTVLARCAVVAVGIVAFVVVTEAATLIGPHVLPASPGAPTVAAQGVAFRVVQPGDTLWSIAADLDGGGDLRARVDRLARLNGGATLRAGETIRVPLEWAAAQP